MKPTRNIPRQNNPNLWNPKSSVWFKKNDDGKLGAEKQAEAEAYLDEWGGDILGTIETGKRKRIRNPDGWTDWN